MANISVQLLVQEQQRVGRKVIPSLKGIIKLYEHVVSPVP